MNNNAILGYQFNNQSLLKQALTHPSLCSKNDGELISYERFEFLGDAVLNLVIAELLLNKFPQEDEGKLARRRSSLVSGEMLAKIAAEIDLGKHIIMSDAEEKYGGRDNENNLENVMESVIASIYLDGGLDITKSIIYKTWKVYLDNMNEVPIDAKSKLQELLQKHGYPLPKYELVDAFGPKHDLTFKIALNVEGIGAVVAEGKSKRQAEKEAAVQLLKLMEK
jgi:ribonuclease-3